MKAQHKNFLKMAISIACQNVKSGNGGPFGAVIVKDGQVIATGTNLVTLERDPTAHAEIGAIRSACATLNSFQLNGCVIYSSCEPCPMCLGAIYWARIERLFFAASRITAAAAGFDDSLIYNEINLPINERKVPVETMLRGEGEKPFVMWKSLKNKVVY
jgi:guanine deaminase